MKCQLDDKTHKFYDIVCKAFSIAVLIVAAIVALAGHNAQHRANVANQVFESRVFILKEQFDIYRELVDITARIASESYQGGSSEKWDQALADFRVIYYGDSLLIFDPKVQELVEELRVKLDQSDAELDRPKIRELARTMGNVCRESIMVSWRLEE